MQMIDMKKKIDEAIDQVVNLSEVYGKNTKEAIAIFRSLPEIKEEMTVWFKGFNL